MSLHLPSIVGRARADSGALLLAGAVVALSTLLACAVPVRLHHADDAAVADAVTRAGPRAAIVVDAPFEPDDSLTGRTRQSNTAALVAESTGVAEFRLGPALTRVLRPPLGAVTSSEFTVLGDQPRSLQLAYLISAGDGARGPGGAGEAGGASPRLTWTAGGPPKASVPAGDADTAVRSSQAPWPVQIGVSQQTAATLGLRPGERIPAQDRAHRALDLRVSGIFRALDPNDPAWQAEPQLLRPVSRFDGQVSSTALGGLLSAASLPDARLALDQDDLAASITFTPDPARLRWRDTPAVGAKVVALKASSGSPGASDNALQWQSGLDSVLRDVLEQVRTATAQATVLLAALVTTAGLLLLLAADLLARRRTEALANARRRGAALPAMAAELLIESSLVALAGGGLGLLLGRIGAGGFSWQWPAPVVLTAVLAPPVLATRVAARATLVRRVPANRSARRSALRTGQLRRAALEATVLLATAGAFVALQQRGIASTSAGLLPALAPTLGAVSGALLLLRLLTPAVRIAVALASRSRRSLPLISAARFAQTAPTAGALPFVVVTLSLALITFTLAVSITQQHRQAARAWLDVGADARLDLPPSVPTTTVTILAQRLAASPGVAQVVTARVADDVPVVSGSSGTYLRLVVVDTVAFERLLAATPLPDAPQLARLRLPAGRPSANNSAGPPDRRLPALLRSPSGDVRAGQGLSVSWNHQSIPLDVRGTAPAVAEGEGDVLIVDAAAFTAAFSAAFTAGGAAASTAGSAADATPNTVWVTGPRAAQAISAVAGTGVVAVGHVIAQRDVLAARRGAPLAAGLLHLADVAAVVLLLFGLLAGLLGPAASAPSRNQTLARLRTLGLTGRQARLVSVGELLPPIVLGVLGGLAIGLLLAHATLVPDVLT